MKCLRIFSLLVLSLLFYGVAYAVTVRNVVYDARNSGAVVFNHESHLKQKGIVKNCRACHDAIFDLKKKKKYSMSDMEKGISCGACHNGKKAFGLAKCSACHHVKDVTYAVKETGPTHFSHAIHLKNSECGACHPTLYAPNQKNKRVGMAAMEKGASCGACHNGKKAFELAKCSACHPFKDITYAVKETGPTHFRHTVHVARTGCGSCHPSLYAPNQKNRRAGMAAMEKGSSCGACHNGKRAFPVKECSKCHPVRELVFKEKSTGDVVFSHTFHTSLYSCSDCHVSVYKTSRGTVPVLMQQMESGKSCGSCHDGKTAFSVKDKCESCHKM